MSKNDLERFRIKASAGESGETPGLWAPRLHPAIARDRAQVANRFGGLEKKICSMSEKLDLILQMIEQQPKAQPIRPRCPQDESDISPREAAHLETRVERLEMLLLRESISECKALDREICAMLPDRVGVTSESLSLDTVRRKSDTSSSCKDQAEEAGRLLSTLNLNEMDGQTEATSSCNHQVEDDADYFDISSARGDIPSIDDVIDVPMDSPQLQNRCTEASKESRSKDRTAVGSHPLASSASRGGTANSDTFTDVSKDKKTDDCGDALLYPVMAKYVNSDYWEDVSNESDPSDPASQEAAEPGARHAAWWSVAEAVAGCDAEALAELKDLSPPNEKPSATSWLWSEKPHR